jgi:protein-S-isoprenylcysteine O-methyltransferase Ste14
MFNTKRADWLFILPASFVWICALVVTARDFVRARQSGYRFGLVNLVGLISMLTGVTLRVWARKTLGKEFSLGLRTLGQHRLVKHGIYRHVRHPAYAGNFLFWFGVPLFFSSWRGFLVMLLLIPCFLYRIRIEEHMLIDKFGNEYLDYMRTSRRLIPYLF